MGLSKARLFRKGTYGGGHVELPKDLTRFWSGWLWNPRSSTILVNSSMVSGGCSLAYLWRSDLVCGVLKVAAPKLKVFPMSKCCCIHDDIYWRWPTLTTLKPFFKIDCGTQQLQKSIPSKLKMCIWKGLLESKVIWSLVAVSQGQKVNHLFLVNKSMNSNRTSYAMRAWLVWKTQCSCPSYFKSASQGKRLWIQKFIWPHAATLPANTVSWFSKKTFWNSIKKRSGILLLQVHIEIKRNAFTGKNFNPRTWWYFFGGILWQVNVQGLCIFN